MRLPRGIMKCKLLSFCVFITMCFSLSALVHTVAQDSTGQYSSVQEAIYASESSDTVLVMPGTYYENINFSGKSISLFSLTAITNDPSYTAVTILDGRQQASVIKAVSRENIQIIGFTICNGNGNTPNYYNSCTGGGVDLFHSSALIKNCIIKRNLSSLGGGISVWSSQLNIINSTIKENIANRVGAGIAMMDTSSVTFDVAERCNIYKNMAPYGSDIFKHYRVAPFTLVVDTFTVLQPDEYFLVARNSSYMAHTVTVTRRYLARLPDSCLR